MTLFFTELSRVVNLPLKSSPVIIEIDENDGLHTYQKVWEHLYYVKTINIS